MHKECINGIFMFNKECKDIWMFIDLVMTFYWFKIKEIASYTFIINYQLFTELLSQNRCNFSSINANAVKRKGKR